MDGESWKRYFERNATRAPLGCGEIGDNELSAELRLALIHAIAAFQLGEAGGGRLAREIHRIPDPALDSATRRSIELYVLEEGRHARELGSLLGALGGRPLAAHWSNSLFSGCRRALGLRTKLVTMAVAEVVGIVFYRAIAERAGAPSIARLLGVIAREEGRHLDFQSYWFGRALGRMRPGLRAPYMAWLAFEFFIILGAAITTVIADHFRLFRLLDMPGLAFVRACLDECWPRLRAVARAEAFLHANESRAERAFRVPD